MECNEKASDGLLLFTRQPEFPLIRQLETHKINVKRSDAEFLLSIRNGAWTYDELIEWAESKNKIINNLYETSTLRREPERTKINDWLIETQEKFYKLNG